MSHQIVTARLPMEQVERIATIADEMSITRSTLLRRILEEFMNEVDRRGYLIPPYEGDEILDELRFGCRRQDAKKNRTPKPLSNAPGESVGKQ